jgi:hypothetical protein
MNTKYSQWYPITNTPNLYGYYAIRHSDKTRVEIVRCYQGEWTIFTYRNGEMTDECRNRPWEGRTLSFRQVRALACNAILQQEPNGIVGLSNTGKIPPNNKQLET